MNNARPPISPPLRSLRPALNWPYEHRSRLHLLFEDPAVEDELATAIDAGELRPVAGGMFRLKDVAAWRESRLRDQRFKAEVAAVVRRLYEEDLPPDPNFPPLEEFPPLLALTFETWHLWVRGASGSPATKDVIAWLREQRVAGAVISRKEAESISMAVLFRVGGQSSGMGARR
ncbi:MAG: hypothetical protein FJ246_10090 [Nitrospira sp.]|nr:hypothetical protein [Nitrospira sp.]